MASVINVDSKPPDLGLAASTGFASQVYAGSRPYARCNRRVTTVDGGGFQTTVKRDDEVLPVAGKPIATND